MMHQAWQKQNFVGPAAYSGVGRGGGGDLVHQQSTQKEYFFTSQFNLCQTHTLEIQRLVGAGYAHLEGA